MGQKSIKKNIFMNVILTVSNFLFPLITYGYVARVLGADGTGKVAFVDSILAYFLYFASMGIPAYGRREVAKARDNRDKLSKLVNELLVLNTISTVISIIVLIIIVLFFPKLNSYSLLFLIMGVQIVLKLIGVEWFYEGTEEYTYITIRSIIFKAISVVLTFVLIRSKNDILWYAFVHVFTISASYICNFINLRKYIDPQRPTLSDIKMHLQPVMVLFFAAIAITIHANFDVSMLGLMDSEYSVGIYNIALKIKSIVISISSALTAVMIPRLSYYFNKKDDENAINLLSKSIRLSFITTIPVAFYVIINSIEVIKLVGGDEFIPASGTLIVLMVCCVFLIITNLLGAQILIPLGLEKRYMQSVVVGVSINIILNLILIPYYGAFGASIGTLVTELWNVFWMSTGCLEYVNAIRKNVTVKTYIIGIVFASLANIIVKMYISRFNNILVLSITTICFFGVYYGILFLCKEELFCSEISKLYNKIRRS